MSAVQVAGTVLEATGVIKRGDPSKTFKDVDLRIVAGDQLNQTASGQSLSLVTRIYILRSTEGFKAMTHDQLTFADGEREALGETLISTRELTLIPGKSYDIKLKVPGDATAIGIAGMFRAPFQNRWKLAFDNQGSYREGIIIGAHACAFSASRGELIQDISPNAVRSLVGIQCNP